MALLLLLTFLVAIISVAAPSAAEAASYPESTRFIQQQAALPALLDGSVEQDPGVFSAGVLASNAADSGHASLVLLQTSTNAQGDDCVSVRAFDAVLGTAEDSEPEEFYCSKDNIMADLCPAFPAYENARAIAAGHSASLFWNNGTQLKSGFSVGIPSAPVDIACAAMNNDEVPDLVLGLGTSILIVLSGTSYTFEFATPVSFETFAVTRLEDDRFRFALSASRRVTIVDLVGTPQTGWSSSSPQYVGEVTLSDPEGEQSFSTSHQAAFVAKDLRPNSNQGGSASPGTSPLLVIGCPSCGNATHTLGGIALVDTADPALALSQYTPAQLPPVMRGLLGVYLSVANGNAANTSFATILLANDVGDVVVLEYIPCGQGQEYVEGGSGNDSFSCQRCRLGFTYERNRVCVPVSLCNQGFIEDLAPTYTSDRTCKSLGNVMRSCRHYFQSGTRESGYYQIISVHNYVISVHCDFSDPHSVTQSLFSLREQALYVDDAAAVCVNTVNVNDDNTFMMWGDLGAQVLADRESIYPATGLFQSISPDFYAADPVGLTAQDFGPQADSVAVIPFPVPGIAVWLNWEDATLSIEGDVIADFSAYCPFCGPRTQSTRTIIVTDGIDTFSFEKIDSNPAKRGTIVCTIDWISAKLSFKEGASLASVLDSDREPNRFGTVLWTVDGKVMGQTQGSVYWGGSFTSVASLSEAQHVPTFSSQFYSFSSAGVGGSLFGMVDWSGYVLFGDRGKDKTSFPKSGFGCRKGDFGFAQTNIQLIEAFYPTNPSSTTTTTTTTSSSFFYGRFSSSSTASASTTSPSSSTSYSWPLFSTESSSSTSTSSSTSSSSTSSTTELPVNGVEPCIGGYTYFSQEPCECDPSSSVTNFLTPASLLSENLCSHCYVDTSASLSTSAGAMLQVQYHSFSRQPYANEVLNGALQQECLDACVGSESCAVAIHRGSSNSQRCFLLAAAVLQDEVFAPFHSPYSDSAHTYTAFVKRETCASCLPSLSLQGNDNKCYFRTDGFEARFAADPVYVVPEQYLSGTPVASLGIFDYDGAALDNVAFELSVPSGWAFDKASSEHLLYTREDPFENIASVTVSISAPELPCITSTPLQLHTGSDRSACTQEVSVVIEPLSFSCPPDDIFILRDATSTVFQPATGAIRSHASLGHIIEPSQLGQDLSYGTHLIKYTWVGAASSGANISCTSLFEVIAGIEGEVESVNSVASRYSILSFLLGDIFAFTTRLPVLDAFLLDPTSPSAIVTLNAPEGSPFLARTPLPEVDYQLRALVGLHFCPDGVEYDARLPIVQTVAVVAYLASGNAEGGSDEHVILSGSMEASVDSADCLAIEGTIDMPESITFATLGLRLGVRRDVSSTTAPPTSMPQTTQGSPMTSTSEPRRRRRTPSGLLWVYPDASSQVLVELSRKDTGPLTADVTNSFEPISLQDEVAPVILNCPSEDLYYTTDTTAEYETVTLPTLELYDNVGIVSVVGMASGEVTLNVYAAPHHQTIIVADEFQSTTCEYDIYFNIPEQAHEIPVVFANFTSEEESNALLSRDFISYNLLRTSFTENEMFPISFAGINQLRFALKEASDFTIIARDVDRADQVRLVAALELETTSSFSSSYAFDANDVNVRCIFDFNLTSEVSIPLSDIAATFDFTANGGSISLAASAVLTTDQHFKTLHVAVTFRQSGDIPGDLAVWSPAQSGGSFIGFQYAYDSRLRDESSRAPVVVEDLSPPQFVFCPANIRVETNEAGADVAWQLPIAVDAFDPNPVLRFASLSRNLSQTSATFPITAPGEPGQLLAYNASDAFGNTVSCTFHVQVVDIAGPSVSCANNTIEANAVNTTFNAAAWLHSVTDNNGNMEPQLASSLSTTLPLGRHAQNISYADAYGNTGSCIAYLTITDSAAPTLTCSDISGVIDGASIALSDISEEAVVVMHAEEFDGESTPYARVSVSAFAQDNIALSMIQVHEGTSAAAVHEAALGSLPLSTVYQQNMYFHAGMTRLTIVVRDLEGNEGQCQLNVNVVDTTTLDGNATTNNSASLLQGNTIIIVGALCGVILLVVLVAYVIVRRKKQFRPQNWEDIFDEMDKFRERCEKSGGATCPREIRRAHIREISELGKGQFGVVSKSRLTESSGIPGYLVAVKSLHDKASGQDRIELLAEAAVMAQFNHENVVSLIGAVTAGDPIMIVLEYMENGCLKAHLENSGPQISQQQRIQFVQNCVDGLNHIHQKGFIHRDVAARNVLLSSEMIAKVADFGLTRETDETSDYYRSRGGALPVKWTAPEALEMRKFDEKTDVWSMGILMYEIYTNGEQPYKGMSNQKVWVSIQEGFRLPRPTICSEEMYAIMLKCWEADPTNRPALSQLSSMVMATPAGNEEEESELMREMKRPLSAMGKVDRAASPVTPPRRHLPAITDNVYDNESIRTAACSPSPQYQPEYQMPVPVAQQALERGIMQPTYDNQACERDAAVKADAGDYRRRSSSIDNGNGDGDVTFDYVAADQGLPPRQGDRLYHITLPDVSRQSSVVDCFEGRSSADDVAIQMDAESRELHAPIDQTPPLTTSMELQGSHKRKQEVLNPSSSRVTTDTKRRYSPEHEYEDMDKSCSQDLSTSRGGKWQQKRQSNLNGYLEIMGSDSPQPPPRSAQGSYRSHVYMVPSSTNAS